MLNNLKHKPMQGCTKKINKKSIRRRMTGCWNFFFERSTVKSYQRRLARLITLTLHVMILHSIKVPFINNTYNSQVVALVDETSHEIKCVDTHHSRMILGDITCYMLIVLSCLSIMVICCYERNLTWKYL